MVWGSYRVLGCVWVPVCCGCTTGPLRWWRFVDDDDLFLLGWRGSSAWLRLPPHRGPVVFDSSSGVPVTLKIGRFEVGLQELCSSPGVFSLGRRSKRYA